jgi:hypothetical protein
LFGSGALHVAELFDGNTFLLLHMTLNFDFGTATRPDLHCKKQMVFLALIALQFFTETVPGSTLKDVSINFDPHRVFSPNWDKTSIAA